MANLEHSFVQDSFETQGYKLLNKYINSKTKLEFECPNGHRHSILWNHWQKGVRCAYCRKNRPITHNDVENAFNAVGYKLLDQYVNSKTHMRFICDKGHHSKIQWLKFNDGVRCGECSPSKVLSQDFVSKTFADLGYTLLDTYKNNHTLMRFRCSKGHTHQITWMKLKKGDRCPYCTGSRVIHSEVKEIVENSGYKVLKITKDSKTRITAICPKNHKITISWGAWKRGGRCGECSNYGFDPNKTATLYYIRFEFNSKIYYKIGITNRTIQERFACEPLPYTIIYAKSYLFGDMAYREEQRLLKKHAKHKYKGHPILDSGNTELFTRDVLKLDTQPHILKSTNHAILN